MLSIAQLIIYEQHPPETVAMEAGELGKRLAEITREWSHSSPASITRLQAAVIDLAPNDENARSLLQGIILRRGFQSLIKFGGTGRGSEEKDALIRELQGIYSEEYEQYINRFLCGFLHIKSSSSDTYQERRLPPVPWQQSAERGQAGNERVTEKKNPKPTKKFTQRELLFYAIAASPIYILVGWRIFLVAQGIAPELAWIFTNKSIAEREAIKICKSGNASEVLTQRRAQILDLASGRTPAHIAYKESQKDPVGAVIASQLIGYTGFDQSVICDEIRDGIESIVNSQ